MENQVLHESRQQKTASPGHARSLFGLLWVDVARNLTVGALLGEIAESERCRHLANVLQVLGQAGIPFSSARGITSPSVSQTMQVDMEWKINEVSDGTWLKTETFARNVTFCPKLDDET